MTQTIRNLRLLLHGDTGPQPIGVLTWDELNALLKSAGILRPARIVQNAKEIVKRAKDQWPLELQAAPARMRDEVTRRLPRRSHFF